jgi:hypothetical protein
MWTLERLIEHAHTTKVFMNGNWFPARPINGTKYYMPFFSRIKDAWAVLVCRAEAFVWPEKQ